MIVTIVTFNLPQLAPGTHGVPWKRKRPGKYLMRVDATSTTQPTARTSDMPSEQPVCPRTEARDRGGVVAGGATSGCRAATRSPCSAHRAWPMW